MPDPPIVVDDILGAYSSPRLLDSGGQKLVYRAVDNRYGDIVVKIGRYVSPESLERARREVSILSAINSPRFPRQYEFNVVDSTRYVITEQYISGDNLERRMLDFTTEADVIRLGVDIVEGLRELWDRRVVHRDIKPKNIMIASTGPVIIDLGIARLLDNTSLTHSAAPFGPLTPQYASPEQFQNRKRDIDWRSDQFNLGIILAQLILRGEHPFDPRVVGSGESIPMNILSEKWAKDKLRQAASASSFTVIERMLLHNPYQRFRLAVDLQHALFALRGTC